VCLPGEDFLGEELVHAWPGVGAGVGQDEDLVVAVGGVADGGQDHAAGADPGEDEGGDAAIAQLLIEVGGGEGAAPGLATASWTAVAAESLCISWPMDANLLCGGTVS
jgi:hypothetical protein